MKDFIKNEYLIINIGVAFMGVEDWDGEISINLQAYSEISSPKDKILKALGEKIHLYEHNKFDYKRNYKILLQMYILY